MNRLPVLSRGWHRNASNGCCLMELASLIAGEMWSDRPRSVNPVLGCVARCVNDWSSPKGRRALLPYVVPLLGTADIPEPVSARLVAHCLRTALTWPVRGRGRLERSLRTAEKAAGGTYRHVVAPLVAAKAVRAIARTAGANRDLALRCLLDDCVALCREHRVQASRISRTSRAVSLGVRPTRIPADSRASFLAAAVPAEPETIAPA